MSLPRNHRLTGASDFQKVFKTAKKFPSPAFNIYSVENNLNSPRLGIVLAKKQIPYATSRNRVRRIIRESFRLQSEIPPLDIIIIGYNNLLEFDNRQIFQVLNQQWQKLIRYYRQA